MTPTALLWCLVAAFVAGYLLGRLTTHAQWRAGLWEEETMEDAMVRRVTNCSRCGQDHDRVVFRVLREPVGDYEYSGTCPNTGNEILAKIEWSLPEGGDDA